MNTNHKDTKGKKQRGFLLVVAVIMIVIVSFIGVIIAYMYAGSTRSATSALQSTQAFYIASSGLESAKRAITISGTSCTAIATTHTAVAFGNGQYSVTGTANSTSSTLSAGITTSSTTIPVVASSTFTSKGVVVIDNEIIPYNGISNTSSLKALLNAARGSIATTHSAGAKVSQKECVLTASAGIPNLTSPETKRVIQQTLISLGFSLFGMTPAVSSAGNVTFNGAGVGVVNGTVSSTDSPYPRGSTVVARNNLSICTFYCGTSLGDGPSTWNGHIQPDVQYGGTGGNCPSCATNITPANMQTSFFSRSLASIKSDPSTVNYNASSMSSSALLDALDNSSNYGKTIYVTGDVDAFQVLHSTTIGSTTQPVILIIDGNANLDGFLLSNYTINGLLYVTGSLSTFGLLFNRLDINGALAVQGNINLTGLADYIDLDPTILSTLASINPNMATNYNSTGYGTQELFR